MDKIRRIGRVARVGRIGGMGATRPMRADRVAMTGGGVHKLDLMPEALRVAARRIGDERAKRAWKLQERGVVGSLPELCAYDWLERRKLRFEFQSGQMGGRQVSGGAVVDFIISGLSANGLYIWRVQGEYWHQGPDVELKDTMQAQRLMRLRIGGVPVAAVVDLWENDVYDRFPEVFELAEFGVGMRG